MAESEEQFPNQQAQRTEKQKEPKIGHAGNVEFERLDIADLREVPVVAQALDNQWVPRELLGPAFRAGGITPTLDKKLKKLVRSEYIRSLINGQQVIFNRAYLYNSAAVAQDYAEKQNPMREVFKEFLAKETIVPFLLAEKTPVEPPSGGRGVKPFGVTETFPQWQEVCQEVRPRCLRLSWDDEENNQLLRMQLTRRLANFAKTVTENDTELYLKDLGLNDSDEESFRQRLIDVERFCLDLAYRNEPISRDALYKKFVVAGEDPEQQNTAERRYDRSKPFAAELKQLFDLRYNCNLPDVLNGYLITPVDSLPRTALQELQQVKKQPDINGEDIVTMLKRTVFALVQQGLNLPSLDVLSLQDVAEIRRMDEWTVYMEQLKTLLADPLGFANGGAAHVYESYELLTRRITELVANQEGKKHLLTTWSPAVEIVFSIAGAVLSMLLTPAGPIFSLSGQVAGLVAGGTASVVGKLIIRDVKEKRAQEDLSTSIDFLRRRLQDARKQWSEIEGLVRELPGFQEGAAPMETEEIVDPTLNHPDNQDTDS